MPLFLEAVLVFNLLGLGSNMFHTLILLAIVLLSSAAHADPTATPPIETIPPGEDKITPVTKGTIVPYDGQLFDPMTSIRWANWLQQYRYRLVWDVQKEQQVCQVEMKYRDDLLVAEEERAKQVEDDLLTRLERSESARLAAEEEARNPPWYATPVFGAVIGAVATAAVFGVAVAAVSATRAP